jgi:hypothetical protein
MESVPGRGAVMQVGCHNRNIPDTRFHSGLLASLPRRMERRFRLRNISVQPLTQPSVELARGFAFDPVALAEEFRSALKLSRSERRLGGLADGRQQLLELVLGKFFIEQGLLTALVLQGSLVVLAICFSAAILTQTTKADWTAYLNRAMLNMAGRDESQRLYDFLKYGSWTHHWNEFVFQGYHNHQHDAIFLAGIPDVKGSLPHASKGRR